MPVSELLWSGLELMIMGMGVVFILLGLLVFTVHGVSRLIQRFEARQPQPSPGAGPAPSASTAQGNTELMAVISTAVHRFRSRRHTPR
ncbi:OadG family protein [Thioalbus denitrificans]|uniref:Probable oxaloacetate decarboxylase gamma chain n=1 Tax=Thioalbus denitrificans TaxID=547122 RepID=A0A369BTA8_9GAMM|nr:OadG family protein [Thioalbus denitrificans]RCX24793.1 oxaloacetate decarboxylase gamma subunit [Thioalbus denitrificans]